MIIIIIMVALWETCLKHATVSSLCALSMYSMLILRDTFLGVLQVFTPVFFAWEGVGHLRGLSCSLPQPFTKFREPVVLGFLPVTCSAHQLLFPPETWLILGNNQSFPFFLVKFPVTASQLGCKHLCSKCKTTAADAFIASKRLEEGQIK